MVHSQKFVYHGKTYDVALPADHISIDPLAGSDSWSGSGHCYGVEFQDEITGRQYKKAVVKAYLDIEVTQETGKFDSESNQVIIDGIICPMTDLFCQDSVRGAYVWEVVTDSCHNRHMELTYRPGVKYTPDDPDESPVVIVEDPAKKHSLGLVIMGYDDSCGMRTHTTQIDNIRVVLGNAPMKALNFTPANSDQFMSMKAAIHHRFITTGLTTRETFKVLVEESCETKKSVLRNALAKIQASNMMTVDVEGFDFVGTKIIRTGRSAQILRCEKAEAVYRQTEECWTDVPVTFRNESVFVDSLNEIIKQNSTRAFCSSLYPIQYKIRDEWYCSDPVLRPCGRTEVPIKLRPRLTKSANYTVQLRFVTLAYKGYTEDQCEAMAQWERFQDAVAATLRKLGAGKQKDQGNTPFGDIADLFPKESLDSLSKLLSQNMWGFFTGMFGNPYKQLQEWEGAISMFSWVLGGFAGVYVAYQEHGWCFLMLVQLIMPAVSQTFFPIWLALYFRCIHKMVRIGPCPHQLAIEKEKKEREEKEKEGKSVWQTMWNCVKRVFCGRARPVKKDLAQHEYSDPSILDPGSHSGLIQQHPTAPGNMTAAPPPPPLRPPPFENMADMSVRNNPLLPGGDMMAAMAALPEGPVLAAQHAAARATYQNDLVTPI